MATSFEYVEGTPVNILAESFPKLSVVNVYLKSKRGSQNTVICAESDRIMIPSMGIATGLKGVCFDICAAKTPQSVSEGVAHYRLLTKPRNSAYGSKVCEVFSRDKFSVGFDEGSTHLLKSSLNEVSLMEKATYQAVCRSCTQKLSGAHGVKFRKVRSLPGFNWEEAASDMWYCHPPHEGVKSLETGSCGGISLEQTQQGLSAMTLTDDTKGGVGATTGLGKAIRVLESPEADACYYGTCYWVVNPGTFPGVKYDSSRVSNDSSTGTGKQDAYCKFCDATIGVFSSISCLVLWDFGIVWWEGQRDPASVSKFENIASEEKYLENFKSCVFSCLHDWSFSLTCRLLISPVDPETSDSLFLWCIDRNLTLFKGQVRDNKNSNMLEETKVVKLLFSPVIKGHVKYGSSFDNEALKNLDTDHHITIPNLVLAAGISTLELSSQCYPSWGNNMKCGFLAYSS